jgi:hypothetical protein
LVLLCAWLESVPDEPTETTENTENIGKDSAESQTQKQAQSEPQWCIGTVEHWIARLLPLWSTTSSELKPIQGVNVPSPEEHDETIVVICNRTGVERGKSSTPIKLLPLSEYFPFISREYVCGIFHDFEMLTERREMGYCRNPG